MEPSVHGELDRKRHVLPHARPRCDGAKNFEVLAQPLVECIPNAFPLVLWIDPDIDPELLWMIHPGNMLTLSKPNSVLDFRAKTRVSFERKLSLVETTIF